MNPLGTVALSQEAFVGTFEQPTSTGPALYPASALQMEALSAGTLGDAERRASGRTDRRHVASPGRRNTDPDPGTFAAFR